MHHLEGQSRIELHIPDTLCAQLRARTNEIVPLSYLIRDALRQAVKEGLDFETPAHSEGGALIVLSLSAMERFELSRWTRSHGISECVAVLSLVSAAVARDLAQGL